MPKGIKRPADPNAITVELLVRCQNGAFGHARLKGDPLEIAGKLVHAFKKALPKEPVAPPVTL